MEPKVVNPQRNVLPSHIAEPDLLSAIALSGYPLQSRATELLRSAGLQTDEEWPFVDRHTGQLRSIDIVATRPYLPRHGAKQPRCSPSHSFIVECQQSEVPFVFFRGALPPRPIDFPSIVGLPHDEVRLHTGRLGLGDSYVYSCGQFIGIDEQPYPSWSGTIARNFTKVEHERGKKLRVSGAASYTALVEPLMSAAAYFRVAEAPIETFHYFDATAVVALAVLDAPMLTVNSHETAGAVAMTPWVRLIRQEARPTEHPFQRTRASAIDVVHIDFLPRYLADWWKPFADWYDRAVLRRSDILASGHARGPAPGRAGAPVRVTAMKTESLTSGPAIEPDGSEA